MAAEGSTPFSQYSATMGQINPILTFMTIFYPSPAFAVALYLTRFLLEASGNTSSTSSKYIIRCLSLKGPVNLFSYFTLRH